MIYLVLSALLLSAWLITSGVCLAALRAQFPDGNGSPFSRYGGLYFWPLGVDGGFSTDCPSTHDLDVLS